MRTAAYLFVSFLLLSGLPLVSAQHHATIDDIKNDVTINDGPQDVAIAVAPRANGSPQNASQGGQSQFDHLDILQVFFGEETDKTFTIKLAMKTLTVPNGMRAERSVLFSYGKFEWRVHYSQCTRSLQGTTPVMQGCLGYRDSRGGFRLVKAIPVAVEGNTLKYTIEKALVYNENRVPARFGDSLTNLSASASQTILWTAGLWWVPGGDPVGGANAFDKAPNQVQPDIKFQFVKGSNANGHLALSAGDPIRVSNGEATTIVYKVDIFNHHTEPLTVSLETTGVRPTWTVRTPALLKLQPGSTLQFPVILAMPFEHEHAKTILFQVKAQAVEDPGSFATTDLGVFWTDIPQPSGHHECDSDETCGQWFHSAPSPENFLPDQADTVMPILTAWMNGVATDPDPSASDVDVPAFVNEGLFCAFPPNTCAAPPPSKATWFFPLAPELLMGVDFDLSRQGRMTFDIGAKLPGQGKVTVRLLYCEAVVAQGCKGGGGWGDQAKNYYKAVVGQGTASAAMTANGNTHFEVPITIEPAFDLLPYKRGHNVGIEVILITDTPENTFIAEPRPVFVTKKAHLHLPLIEYHDPIDEALLNVGSLRLTSLDPFEKLVNPGRAAIFRFDIANEADTQQQVAVDVQGVNSDWASLVGTPEIRLEPKSKQNFSVLVTPPEDAEETERAELFIVVQSLQDPNVVAVTRLRATVTKIQDIPDESGQAGLAKETNDAPSPAFFGLVVAVGAAVALARRRKA